MKTKPKKRREPGKLSKLADELNEATDNMEFAADVVRQIDRGEDPLILDHRTVPEKKYRHDAQSRAYAAKVRR